MGLLVVEFSGKIRNRKPVKGAVMILSHISSNNYQNFMTLHYANAPMQYTALFHGCKNVHFQIKLFIIFAQNIDCRYTLEPPH